MTDKLQKNQREQQVASSVETQKTQTVVNVQSADFRSIYANNVAYALNPFDFSIYFGEMKGVDQEESTLTVEQKVKVTMSALQAKILRDILINQVGEYEKNFGPIKMPFATKFSPAEDLK